MEQNNLLKHFYEAFKDEAVDYEPYEDYLEYPSSAVEGVTIKIADNFNKLSDSEKKEKLKKWSELANEAFAFGVERKLGKFTGENPYYGYFLGFETFAAYPDIVNILNQYLDPLLKDELMQIEENRKN